MAVCASTGGIFLIATNLRLIDSLRQSLRSSYHRLEIVSCLEDFLERAPENGPSCLLLEFGLAGLDHTDVQRRLAQNRRTLPFIFVLGGSDTPATVAAMRAGAFSVIAPPFEPGRVLAEVEAALARSEDSIYRCNEMDALRQRFGSLTAREAGLISLVAMGKPNKQIANKLGIEESTVKVHRGRVMRKMGAESVAQLALMAEKLNLLSTIGSKAKHQAITNII